MACCHFGRSWVSSLLMKMIDLLIEIAAMMMMMFEVIAVGVKEAMMTMMHCRRWQFCCFYEFRRKLRRWWYRNSEFRHREVWDDVGLVVAVNGNLMLNECHDDLSNCLIIDRQIIDVEGTGDEIYFHRRLIFPRLKRSIGRRRRRKVCFIWTTVGGRSGGREKDNF